jgi:hypothetical protein
MKVYYFFVNLSKNEKNQYGLEINYGLKCITDFYQYDYVEKINIIHFVIQKNKWSMNDLIVISPDYPEYDSYTYNNGTLTKQ